MFDYLVVGCGLAAMTASRILAERECKVLIVDQALRFCKNIL